MPPKFIMGVNEKKTCGPQRFMAIDETWSSGHTAVEVWAWMLAIKLSVQIKASYRFTNELHCLHTCHVLVHTHPSLYCTEVIKYLPLQCLFNNVNGTADQIQRPVDYWCTARISLWAKPDRSSKALLQISIFNLTPTILSFASVEPTNHPNTDHCVNTKVLEDTLVNTVNQ